MEVGRRKAVSDDERRRIAEAVNHAEERTGLQIMVYAGKAKGGARESARRLLVDNGYATVPGIVLLVAPNQHRVEIVTSDHARLRLPDEAAARVIDIMLPAFRRHDWVAGLELGLAAIIDEAGHGPDHGGEELPDFLE